MDTRGRLVNVYEQFINLVAMKPQPKVMRASLDQQSLLFGSPQFQTQNSEVITKRANKHYLQWK